MEPNKCNHFIYSVCRRCDFAHSGLPDALFLNYFKSDFLAQPDFCRFVSLARNPFVAFQHLIRPFALLPRRFHTYIARQFMTGPDCRYAFRAPNAIGATKKAQAQEPDIGVSPIVAKRGRAAAPRKFSRERAHPQARTTGQMQREVRVFLQGRNQNSTQIDCDEHTTAKHHGTRTNEKKSHHTPEPAQPNSKEHKSTNHQTSAVEPATAPHWRGPAHSACVQTISPMDFSNSSHTSGV